MMWIYRKRFWMPLHDTSFRKSAVSMKAKKDRRFTRNGLRNIPNTQKSEKVRWGRGDLSGLFLLTTLSEPYLHSKTTVKEVCVRPMYLVEMRGVEPLSASPFLAASTCVAICISISPLMSSSGRLHHQPASISPLQVEAPKK